MINKKAYYGQVIQVLLISALCSLYIPYRIEEPNGFPRFICLLLMCSFLTITSLNVAVHNFKNSFAWMKFVLISMVISILISTIHSNSEKYNLLLGNSGRYNGVLLTVCLLIIFFLILEDRNLKVDVFFYSLVLSGLFQITYGILQVGNLDPVSWENPQNYNLVFGTFGNPNHYSAFVGYFLVGLLTNRKFVILKLGSLKGKLLLTYCLAIASFTLVKNGSLQGILIIFLGLAVYLVLYIFTHIGLILKICVSILMTSLCILSYLGFLGIGAFRPFLSTETGIYRAEYLRAGVRILQDHFLFGIGADNYEEYFRNYRSIDFTLEKGKLLNVDSSHNLFLDLGLNFGVIFLCSFVFILTVAISSGFKLESLAIRNQSEIKLLPILFCLIAQGFVSTPFVTHLFWIWVIMAFLIRNSRNFKTPSRIEFSEKKIDVKDVKLREISLSGRIALQTAKFAVVTVFSSVAIQASIHEYKFQEAILTRNGDSLVSLSKSKWLSPFQAKYIVQVVYQSGFHSEARSLNEELLTRFPQNFELNLLLYEQIRTLEGAADSNLVALSSRLKKIDPYWFP